MCKTLIKTAPGIQGGGAALQRRGPPVHPWDGCRIFLLVKMFLEVFLAILFSYTDPIPTLYQVYTGLYRPYTDPIPTLYQSYTGLYRPSTGPIPPRGRPYTNHIPTYTETYTAVCPPRDPPRHPDIHPYIHLSILYPMLLVRPKSDLGFYGFS